MALGFTGITDPFGGMTGAAFSNLGLTAPTGVTKDLLNDMINFYEFASGALTTDTQGNNDLTNINTVTYEDSPTQGDTAKFVAANMERFSGMGVSTTGELSLSTVFNTNDLTTRIFFGSGDGEDTRLIEISNSTTIRIFFSGETALTFTVPTISLNTDYHLTAVLAQNAGDVDIQIYLDGIESSSGTLTITTTVIGDFSQIGDFGPNDNSTWDGEMARVRRWDFALTAEDALIVSNTDLKNVLTDMINFYEFKSLATLLIDTQENNNLTNVNGVGYTGSPNDRAVFNIANNEYLTGMGSIQGDEQSISCVFNTNDLTGPRLFGYQASSFFAQVLFPSANFIQVRAAGSGASGQNFNVGTLTTNTDFHVVITFIQNGSSVDMRLYKNGVESTTGLITATSSTVPAYGDIGHWALTADDMDGEIARVRKWDFALNATQALIVSNEDL